MKKSIIFANILFALSLNAAEVKLGVVLPLSGTTAAYGQSALDGIKLAHSMQMDLKNGDKIKLVIIDTKADKLESFSGTQRLISQEKVLGLIGEMVTANTLQVMRVAEQNKIPLIAPAATGDKLLEKKSYSSRVCFMDSFQGSSLAKYTNQTLDLKKAIIITDQSTDYSLGLSRAFEQEFKAQGGTVLQKFTINSGNKDFKALISQIKSFNADFIYIPVYYNEASLFVRQAKNAGLNTLMGSADGVADMAFITLAGNAGENFIFTDSFDSDNPSTQLGKEFTILYNKEKNTKGVPNFTAMGADAYFVMFEAMNTCTNTLTSECINNAIHKTQNFEGVTGKISIDKSGNAIRSVVVKEIKNQKQSYKDTINP
ncbi:ABC transporter substrate-binding protein [Campylobacter sp. MIT 21-1685]|uniref:ABC transporter substrate-binding protein n=1 Tax=unclassified Campylobacter TaxID=2593542 RepID=UPI00224B3D38|nr:MULTISPECIES: ABC transporter substrate-binding protein [unclassified Campylobacter]MCX2682313.1 ABC transporter substrate-binding protein [Campylobacter sp. MIT 21-1684]MCX2750593.1 ABC transporter substrate-binding protein [Campylobacter sp. MIT 21-1682]MCX2806860.1 ABC transporter substrate-binding protein [Campylobacter sp. MIT 21-1685]